MTTRFSPLAGRRLTGDTTDGAERSPPASRWRRCRPHLERPLALGAVSALRRVPTCDVDAPATILRCVRGGDVSRASEHGASRP